MSKLTASYIAGFVDGEGYISIYPVTRKTTYFISCIKITNTNKEIIEWLHDSYGGYFYTRNFGKNKWKTAYTWTLTDKKVVPVLQKITPYLKIKRKQAEIVLKREKLKERCQNLGERKGMVYSEAILKEIENCYLEIKLLNKRGNLCTLRD